MTLDEAIVHAKEKAACGDECGADHAQLAAWLEELKELRAGRSRTVAETLSKLVRDNPHFDTRAEKLCWVDPILGKLHYNYPAIGRVLFQVQKLPDGALPIYDREPVEPKTQE